MRDTSIKHITALKEEHKKRDKKIKETLEKFKDLSVEELRKEFIFCTLTPQSNAKRCWEAVEQISAIKNPEETEISEILRTRTRFHNNKARYLVENRKLWNKTLESLSKPNRSDMKELRNWIAENVHGYGLKEASHFLRNIGKSDNQIAILDRHILRNLKRYEAIADEKIKSKKDYLEKEMLFLKLAEKLNIPADELDLLFWSLENGEVFK